MNLSLRKGILQGSFRIYKFFVSKTTHRAYQAGYTMKHTLFMNMDWHYSSGNRSSHRDHTIAPRCSTPKRPFGWALNC
jgi:hypothetical protein